ncbi:hypothetical protein J1N35_001134 [Gossypium stocksii]|uniref:Reverse transcriptase zinc-binding domain-containing protein n=1 Tax=Gossypium stocksii TaxID=47602 RepID=A0A9D3WJU3_9ROSI|nr:hypothetical protein J1N35_001134 [Gossypium stocksii]
MEKNALWRRVIKSKYGSSRQEWRLNTSRPKEMSVTWWGIVENSKRTKVTKWTGLNSYRWVIGNGKSVLFREDLWCGDKTLKEEFPRLFRLALKKNCFVKDVARNNNFEEVHWESVFSRKLLDREKCMVEKLNFLMSSVVLNEEVEDRINWIHESGGIFLVKKLSYLLAHDGMKAIEFQFDRIRKLKVPSRARSFL